MNCLKLIFLFVAVAGCAQKQAKTVPQVVPSCFRDGDSQERYCKSQRMTEDGKLAVTRCIGEKNKEANALLRGKCVEKICAQESNTDCIIKGEPLVLKQYEELLVSEHFVDETASIQNKKQKTRKKSKASKEIDVDPTVRLNIPEPAAPIVKTKRKPARKAAVQTRAKEPEMVIILKPSRPNVNPAPNVAASPKATAVSGGQEKKRIPASQNPVPPDGLEKVCIAKNDLRAPQSLRGKCATRNCIKGRCSYNGLKDIFEHSSNQ